MRTCASVMLIDEAARIKATGAPPGMFNVLGPNESCAAREPVDGPTADFLAQQGQGTRHLRPRRQHPRGGDGADKAWNVDTVYDPQGELIARYNKIHSLSSTSMRMHTSRRASRRPEMVTFETEHASSG
ncbi:MAG: hypothetical protein R2856_25865 [Caldilineaceae bacterium]